MKNIVNYIHKNQKNLSHYLLVIILSLVSSKIIPQQNLPNTGPISEDKNNSQSLWVKIIANEIVLSNMNKNSFYQLTQINCHECLQFEGLKILETDIDDTSQQVWSEILIPDSINKNSLINKISHKIFELKFSNLTHFSEKTLSRTIKNKIKTSNQIHY